MVEQLASQGEQHASSKTSSLTYLLSMPHRVSSMPQGECLRVSSMPQHHASGCHGKGRFLWVNVHTSMALQPSVFLNADSSSCLEMAPSPLMSTALKST